MKKIYFTLNAHKKCIGQYNFDPLLYYNESGQEHSLVLDLPGTYIIRYISGAICSFNVDTIMNELSANNKNISKNQIYWNRYYEASALMSLGPYDVTYFPTENILLACFQCQFGTLPGFTDTGYKTKTLADTFNRNYLSNLQSKYNYTDILSFSISYPQSLVFWYTNIAQQSVQGSITYSIEYVKDTIQQAYLNDISIIGINKSNILEYSFQNYYLNTQKQNIYNIKLLKTQEAWLTNIENINSIKTICDYNTIGYDQAYINNIKYIDTVNYNQQYSVSYYWELVKKIDSKYNFIGKFNNESQEFLLYNGTYTIILVSSPYKFSKDNIQQDTGMTFLSSSLLIGNTACSFNINSVGIFKPNFLKDKNLEVYLYADAVTIEQLNTYIKSTKNIDTFITQYNQKLITNLQNSITATNILPVQKIKDYNENNYNYYIDISEKLYYDESNPIFYIYATQKIENNLSIGPYTSVSGASGSIFQIFTQQLLSTQYTCEQISSNMSNKNIYLQQYKVYKKENNINVTKL